MRQQTRDRSRLAQTRDIYRTITNLFVANGLRRCSNELLHRIAMQIENTPNNILRVKS